MQSLQCAVSESRDAFIIIFQFDTSILIISCSGMLDTGQQNKDDEIRQHQHSSYSASEKSK